MVKLHEREAREEQVALHLITGGSGVLGRAVAQALLERGHRVRIFDLKEPPVELAGRVEFFRGSILDAEGVVEACAGAEVVHHLAASMPQAKLSPRGFWEINVAGTLHAAEGALKQGARRLVFASTIEIYGLYYPHEFPVTEESEKRFTGIYSRNKWECEERLLEVKEKTGLEVAFPRMPMIFGPGFYHEPSMTGLFRLIRRSWPVPIVADPNAPWASVSSADAAQGFALAAERPEAIGQAFNLAAADAPPCRELLHQLISAVGSRSRTIVVPRRLLEAAVHLIERYEIGPTPAELVRFSLVGGIYSIEKAKKLLGYQPKHSAMEGMLQAYRYLEEG